MNLSLKFALIMNLQNFPSTGQIVMRNKKENMTKSSLLLSTLIYISQWKTHVSVSRRS